ncbi:hypothetical protein GSI_04920 [Ganoderma sinense ZZ0214-1]|uniref:Uncharacterized protein n=1 Tax=Ganoderma sinense ZZ0214-1 TaxID=1077348 RepID=A0A2G8SGB9_9APHY|nr:hypothetical protein GSI_04920 [Ganoderma sinense ZZ0214-1]
MDDMSAVINGRSGGLEAWLPSQGQSWGMSDIHEGEAAWVQVDVFAVLGGVRDEVELSELVMTGETARKDLCTDRTVARCRAMWALAECALRLDMFALHWISTGILRWTAAGTCSVCACAKAASRGALAVAGNMAKAVAVVALGG